MKFALVVLAASLCIFGQDYPSAAMLLDRAVAGEREVARIARQYTYTEEKSDQQVDKDGRLGSVERETFEVVPLEGELYRKLVRVNGQPLPAAQQKKVDADLDKVRQERRRARLGGLTHIERTVNLGGLDELQSLFDNRVTGEELVGERATWVLESTPKPGEKPKDKRQEQILAWSHKSWLDKESGVRIQWRDVAIRDINGFKTGSEFLFRRDLGQEGVWLVREIRGSIEFTAYKIVHARVQSVQTFSNFKKFDVTSTISVGER